MLFRIREVLCSIYLLKLKTVKGCYLLLFYTEQATFNMFKSKDMTDQSTEWVSSGSKRDAYYTPSNETPMRPLKIMWPCEVICCQQIDTMYSTTQHIHNRSYLKSEYCNFTCIRSEYSCINCWLLLMLIHLFS